MTQQLVKKKDNKALGISFFVIYIALNFLVYMMPALKLTVPYVMAGSLMLISLPFVMIKNKKWMIYGIYLCVVSMLFMFSNMLIGMMGTADAVNDVIRNIRYFLPALWALYSLKYCNEKNKKNIFIVFLIITAFITFKTVQALQENIWIARLLAQDQSTSSAEINGYRLQNVGGYPFSYMMGVVTIVFSWMTIKFKNVFMKFLSFAGTIICFYYIIQTMYTTLLLLSTIGVFLVLFFNTKSLLWRLVLVMGVIVLWFSLSPLFGYLSGIFDPESLLSTKFMQMHDAVSGEGIEALGTRPELMSEAFSNWLKTPIFGGAYTTPSHTTYIEFLQQNGIVGLIWWLSLFVLFWKSLYSELKRHNVDTTIFNITMGYLAVLSFFNDTRYTFEITIAVFFIVPLFSSLFCKKYFE